MTMLQSKNIPDDRVSRLSQMLIKRQIDLSSPNINVDFPREITHLIHDLAEEGVIEARDLFMQLLIHGYPDEDVVIALIRALGFHWTDHKSSVSVFAHMLREHPSAMVRLACASALGSLDSNDAIDALLLSICDSKEDEDIRDASFASLMEIAGVNQLRRPKLTEIDAKILCADIQRKFDRTDLKTRLEAIGLA